MKRHRTTPLAWHQMTREKIRLALGIAGIAFATILIFMQLGFLQSLFDGSTLPHKSLNADIVLVNPRQQTFFAPKGFARSRLYELRRYPEVESVATVRVTTLPWRNPETNETRAILVFGVDPAKVTFQLPGVERWRGELKSFNRVLYDNSSRPEFGPISNLLAQKGKIQVELNRKLVTVAGVFDIGASFSADGNVITSDTTFGYLNGGRTYQDINVGLIKVRTGSDVDGLVRRMQKDVGGDLSVLKKSDFVALEENYWASSTGVGFIFGLGVCMGFVVGVVIVYQILHADVADHLSEYATLKAIGYTDSYLLKVLMTEGLLLAVFGFIPGFLFSWLLYGFTAWATLIPISMTWTRGVFVFALTVVMCAMSAAVASRKLRMADPAEIF